ncbi:transcriptional regulator, partial [Bacteroides thetaiotaomicron]|nr:transcriptional regulator [Bacteroides thetaiotaomicron]
RRWVGGDTPIPFSAWAILVEYAGLGKIWKV